MPDKALFNLDFNFKKVAEEDDGVYIEGYASTWEEDRDGEAWRGVAHSTTSRPSHIRSSASREFRRTRRAAVFTS